MWLMWSLILPTGPVIYLFIFSEVPCYKEAGWKAPQAPSAVIVIETRFTRHFYHSLLLCFFPKFRGSAPPFRSLAPLFFSELAGELHPQSKPLLYCEVRTG